METPPVSQLHARMCCESSLLSKIPPEADLAESGRATHTGCGLSRRGLQAQRGQRDPTASLSPLNLSWAPVPSSKTCNKTKIPSLLESQNPHVEQRNNTRETIVTQKRKTWILLGFRM